MNKILKVGSEEVVLDKEILKISQETINQFLSEYSSWYHYYHEKYNDAAYIVKCYKDQCDSFFSSKFKQYKQDNQCSDKMAEACAKSDDELLIIQEKRRMAEYVRDELLSFLKSMDYAHADALQVCYNMRKEMSAISSSYVKREESVPKNIDRKLDKIFNKADES